MILPLEESLRNVPYLDRQIISIVPDNELPNIVDNQDRKNKVVDLVIDLFGGAALSVLLPSSIELVDSVIRLRKKLKSSGKRFRVVGRQEVADLEFPPGHPRIGGVYVAHPTKIGTYFPVADFHRLNFENKVNEAIQILMSLGANEISVSHVRGWGRDFSGKLSGAVEAVNVDLTASSIKSSGDQILFTASLLGSDSPFMPSNLVWYDYEPTWQSVTIGRLDHGLMNFSLTVSYNDDFGVNSELKSQILKSGLNLSGSFTQHENTTWTMSGVFGVKKLNS